MEADWANLGEPLGLILEKLVEPIDQIWFSVVCKNWYSIAVLIHQNRRFQSLCLDHQNHQMISNNVLPMLLIPTKRKSRKKRSLYGISSNRVYHFELPVPYSKRCCGSSHGWLAMVDRYRVITLLNPFKNVAAIRLPPIDIERIVLNRELYECHVHKVILSANPTTRPHDYVVVAIYSMRNGLAFLKAGQKFWTYIDYDFRSFTDVTFYKGIVYAVGRWNNIVSFDLSYSKDHSGREKIIPNVISLSKYGGSGDDDNDDDDEEKEEEDDSYADRAYIVKSLEGDLWLVRKFIDCDDEGYSIGTRSFKVYKLEIDDQSGKLLQMLKLDSLGDNILFVGDSDSISLSASYFSNCLQRDSIYYTDDEPKPYTNGPFDSGIYNVKDGSFSKHYIYKPSFKRMPPPVWVLPPFHCDR